MRLKTQSPNQYGTLLYLSKETSLKSDLGTFNQNTLSSLLSRKYIAIDSKHYVRLTKYGWEALSHYQKASPAWRIKEGPVTKHVSSLLAVARFKLSRSGQIAKAA